MHFARKFSSLLVAIVIVNVLIGCKPENLSEPPQPTHEVARGLLSARAVEAVIWGMPAVNYDLMLQEMLTKTPGKVGQVIYWGRPLDSKNQTLTPNPDALYFMVFFNTQNGPVVLDLPPATSAGSFNGNIVTLWQMPLEDAGLLGLDKGKGAKYLILPPGYKSTAPVGYVALQSDTFGDYMLFRANFKSHSDADVDAAVSYGRHDTRLPARQSRASAAHRLHRRQRHRLRFHHPLRRRLLRKPQQHHPIRAMARSRPRHDRPTRLSWNRQRQTLPAPTDPTRGILTSAAQDARTFLYARYDRGFPPFFSATSHWMYPTYPAMVQAAQTGYADPDTYPIDDRAVAYSYAFIGIKRLGAGQMYLISIKDKNGIAFDGAKTYQLTVPPNAPVTQYWSVTAYDREFHTLIKGMSHASRSSQIPDLEKNADGSVDIYFGPTAPAGKDSNWVPTDPRRQFELMFRAYGPTHALFQKQWILPDVSPIQ